MPAISDLRCSCRGLLRHRAFSTGIILTIGLVLGVSTCLFAVIYGVFFRQLPFPDADRLVLLWEINRDTGVEHLPITEGAYPYYQERLSSLEQVAAFIPHDTRLPSVTIDGTTHRLHECYVTPEIFQLLGARPVLGRTFLPSEKELGAPRVAILSSALWREQFGGRSDVVGQVLTLNELNTRQQYTIVGVMPDGFEFPNPLYPGKPDIWLPITCIRSRFSPGNNFYVLARRKAGIRLREVQSEVNEVARTIALEQPVIYGPKAVSVVPIQTESVRDATAVMASLSGALLFIALIGCANIGHLLMAREGNRRRDAAVRLALGARGSDLFFLATTEMAVLAVVGGGLGLVLSAWGIRVLTVLLPSEMRIPSSALVQDDRVILFACIASLVAAIVLGWRVSRQAIRGQLSADLRCSRSAASRGSIFRRPGSLVLVGEAALGFALVLATVVTMRGLASLADDGARTNPARMLAVDIYLPNDLATPNQMHSYHETLLREARQTRNVASACLADRYPPGQGLERFFISGVTDRTALSAQPAEFHVGSPECFDVLVARLLEGRLLMDSDREQSEPVVVVNEAMSRRYLSSGPIIGSRFRNEVQRTKTPVEWRVVGVIQEPRRLGEVREAPPAVYAPLAQVPMSNLTLLAKTTVDARRVAAIMRDQVLRSIPSARIERIQTGTDIFAKSTARIKFVTMQLSAGSMLALVLASLGIYAVVSFHTSQRTKEIAIRMAMGATASRVLALILRDALILVLAGVALGIPLALGLLRTVATLQIDTANADVPLCLVAGGLLVVIAACAAIFPARRAALLDPNLALREE